MPLPQAQEVEEAMQLAESQTVSIAARSTGTGSHAKNLEILRTHDDPMRWEAPHGFNRSAALREFREFVTHLQELADHTFDYECGSSLDEASFHSEIFLPGGSLRFSNFGRMVAFTEGHDIPSALVRLVSELAAVQGFVLIPCEVLDTRYTGKNSHLGRTDSWHSRYFV
jgi:hypothetical protein